ncbi:hypothetical protein Krac_5577 [Ktedonobacter racemifer DSM 44963]|uniref:Uncharacterized protein n=1 Tax=Ktedonobacter racemifer DSM 44963 TaxID=485913 RepID=D6TWD0_KTERA|nr:hypothetical protein Krac_5577 [Ktedonobacter racemifer DSM 44963]
MKHQHDNLLASLRECFWRGKIPLWKVYLVARDRERVKDTHIQHMRDQQYRINLWSNDSLLARLFQEATDSFELAAEAVRPFWQRYGPVGVPAFRHLPGQNAHASRIADLIIEVLTDDRRQELTKLFGVDSFTVLHIVQHNQDEIIFHMFFAAMHHGPVQPQFVLKVLEDEALIVTCRLGYRVYAGRAKSIVREDLFRSFQDGCLCHLRIPFTLWFLCHEMRSPYY